MARGSVWQNNGDCIGADKDSGDVWIELGGKLHLRPPDIAAKRAFQRGEAIDRPLPYLERNKVIVRSSRAMVATPKGAEELRSGTWSTVRFARKLELPILIIYPDGECVFENWQRKAA